jgi:(p)ppGpp synthase/HD superfamily hydrolase
MDYYRAIHKTLEAHQDQLRKLDGDIYAAHPIEVGFFLSTLNLRDAIVLAGILHDVIEDTVVSYEELVEEFGQDVADLVLECSEKDKSLSWHTRKSNTINYLKTKGSPDMKYIVLADKLSNLQSIYRNLEDFDHPENDPLWDSFNSGYENQKWYYSEIIKALHTLSDLTLYKKLVNYFNLVFTT